MGKLVLINGSPRAPRSNSKKYAEVFKTYYKGEVLEYNVMTKKHEELCRKLEVYSEMLLVFPLYVDSIPVGVMELLKVLECYEMEQKPRVHVIINCGFIEPEQNFVAVEMIKLFCSKNEYPFGSVLCIGGGEAIMTTPFAFLVRQKIKKLAHAVDKNKQAFYTVTMPLSKKTYIKASTNYWLRYGARNGITKEQMECMRIEKNREP